LGIAAEYAFAKPESMEHGFVHLFKVARHLSGQKRYDTLGRLMFTAVIVGFRW
jgi:hypothetical protein